MIQFIKLFGSKFKVVACKNHPVQICAVNNFIVKRQHKRRPDVSTQIALKIQTAIRNTFVYMFLLTSPNKTNRV